MKRAEKRRSGYPDGLLPAMNIHHLELFYYVATHGGISRAVRHMPYGIQQPAVSSQVLQLEEELGVKLFDRVPFKLTAPGAELYGAIEPFFKNLDDLAARVGKKNVPLLRIGAAEMVLADYLPPILARLKKRHPAFRLSLHALGTADLERAFADRQLDIALSPLDRRPSPRLHRVLLVSLPLALVVPRASRWKTAQELWANGGPTEPLICLTEEERICWSFHTELKRRGLEWPVAIEASSLSLLLRYVENGYGVGVAVLSPELQLHRQLRVLPMPDFPPLELYALWTGELTPVAAALLEEVQHFVREEWPKKNRKAALA